VDALEAKACAGVYESGLMRAEVASAGNSLTLRMSWKVHVLDNSPTLESAHAVSLRPLGNQTFEVSAMLPGFPNTQVRFVPSDQIPACGFSLPMDACSRARCSVSTGHTHVEDRCRR